MMPGPALRSRLVPAFALALLVGGCSSNYGGDYRLVYEMATSYWDGSPPISLAEASAVPYASIAVSIGDGRQAMFVLATDDNEDLMWVAGKNIAITTRQGRIIRTSGLEHDLTGFVANTNRSLPETLRNGPGEGERDEWIADFADLNQYAVRVTCTWEAPSDAAITILGTELHTTRFDEKCEAPSIGWSFTNSFWIDRASGAVWRSYQHIRPDMDGIHIDLLRPPAPR